MLQPTAFTSFGELLSGGYQVHIFCAACRRSVAIEPSALPLGRSYVGAMFQCSCGARCRPSIRPDLGAIRRMSSQSADEAKRERIARMGEALGTQYDALWQEVAWLHYHWSEYVELFGTKSKRVDLLNRAAPMFFHVAQDAMWENTLLSLARLTDLPKSIGGVNLTIQSLPALVTDPALKQRTTLLVDSAIQATDFCRDWRNRRIAHRDLGLAINVAAAPMKTTSRAVVKVALNAISAVLNEVQCHYFDSETHFAAAQAINGAMWLLYVIDDGIRAGDQRRARLNRGEFSPDDFPQTCCG